MTHVTVLSALKKGFSGSEQLMRVESCEDGDTGDRERHTQLGADE